MPFEKIATLFGLSKAERGITDPQKGKIALQFDAIIREAPEYTAQPTENEVEDGSVVADHVKLLPEKLTIEAIVSNTPVSLDRAIVGSAAGAVSSAIGGAVGAVAAVAVGSLAGLLQGSSDPAKAAFDFLVELYRNKEPFDIVTGLQMYESHIITSMSPPRTAETANSLEVTLTTQKIKIVTSETVLVPAFKVKSLSATSTQKRGRQGNKKASDASGKRVSLLLQGAQKAGVFN